MTDNKIKQQETTSNTIFNEPWNNSDAILVVEGKALHVHTTILALVSPVFEKMFNGNFKEALTKQVELQGKTYHLIEHMLEIIYPNICSRLGKDGFPMT